MHTISERGSGLGVVAGRIGAGHFRGRAPALALALALAAGGLAGLAVLLSIWIG